MTTDGQKVYLGRFQSKKGGAVAIARWIAANSPGFRPRVSGRVVRGDPNKGVTVDFATFQGSLDAGVDAEAPSGNASARSLRAPEATGAGRLPTMDQLLVFSSRKATCLATDVPRD